MTRPSPVGTDPLWYARHVLLEAAAGRRPLPEGVDRDTARRQSQRLAAARVEALARAVMAGVQPTGAQTDGRRVLVDQAETARMVAAIWASTTREPAEQEAIDQSLGCLRQCFDQGLVVLEWDRPGYDDVTAAFQDLMAFATDPATTPIQLSWVEAPGQPAPAPPAPRRARWGVAGIAAALLMLIAALRTQKDPGPAPLPCPALRQGLRARLAAPDRAGLPDDPTVRAAALARLDAGDPAGAAAILKGSPALGLQQLQVELFVYLHTCP